MFFRTSADGNCLFNACSASLIGNESLAPYLRCLTSLELFMNPGYYAHHPLLAGHARQDSSIFSVSISSKAFDEYDRFDKISAIKAEAKSIANNFTFSSFDVMFALSSVVGMEIEAYYPITNKEPVYEELFNCCIVPREAYQPSSEKIHIFRCRSATGYFVLTKELSSQVDHFVPLLQKNVKQ